MKKKLQYIFLLTSLLFLGGCADKTLQEQWVVLDRKTDELDDDGYSSKAIRKAMKTLEFSEKNFGPDHENTIASRNKLAKFFASNLRYLEAENLYVRSYKTEKAKAGANHYRLVFYYKKLGKILVLQHRFQKAGVLLRKALNIKKKNEDLRDAETVDILEELAGIYEVSAQFEKFCNVVEKLVRIMEFSKENIEMKKARYIKILIRVAIYIKKTALEEKYYKLDLKNQKIGTKEYAKVLMDLGSLKFKSQKYKEAEAYYKKSLKINQKVLVPNHLRLIFNYEKLAQIYESSGDFKKAIKFSKKSLNIYSKLPIRINHYVKSIYYLMSLQEKLGQFDKMEKTLIHFIKIHEKIYGANHPDVLKHINALVSIQFKQNKTEAALLNYKKAVNILKKTYGKNHLNLALQINVLATFYFKSGAFDKAEELAQKALVQLRIRAGENNINELPILDLLVMLTEATGRDKEYLEYNKRILKLLTNFAKAESKFVLQPLNKISAYYSNKNNYEEAINYYLKVVRVKKKIYGEINSHVAKSFNHLAMLYEYNGDKKKAQEYYSKAKIIYNKDKKK